MELEIISVLFAICKRCRKLGTMHLRDNQHGVTFDEKLRDFGLQTSKPPIAIILVFGGRGEFV